MYYMSTGKKIVIGIAITAIVLSLIAIFLYSQGYFEDDPAVESSVGSPGETSEESVHELSKDKFAYECLLNGNLIKLPCTVAELEACGYKLDDKDANTILSPGYNAFADMTLGKDEITLHFVNSFEEDRLYKDCYVYGITVRKSTSINQTFEIYGGLGIGSTLTEVETVYGETPSWEGEYAYEEDPSIFVVYSTSQDFQDGLDDEIEFSITDDRVEIIYFYVGQPE